MKKIFLVLSLVFISFLNASQDEPTHNDVNSFVYKWFSGFDKQVPMSFFLNHLTDDVQMTYPDAKIKSKKDFIKWYENVLKNIASNTHAIRNLEVSGNLKDGWNVTYNVQWKASAKNGEKYDLHVHQNVHIIYDKKVFKITSLEAKLRDLNNQETHLTSLMKAAGYGDVKKVKELISKGVNIFTVDSITGTNVMHLAAQGGNVEVMKVLIENGGEAIINLRAASNNFTPLMVATWYQNPEMIKYLLSLEHINPLMKDHYGRIAADFPVVAKGYKELVSKDKEIVQIYKEYFKKREAYKKEKFEKDGVTPKNLPKDVNIRILNGEGPDYHTALLVASLRNKIKEFDRLVSMGADITAQGEYMKAVVAHKAAYKGNWEIIEKITRHPDFDKIKNAQGPTNGYTPLHDAIWHGHTKTAMFLIDAGVDTSIKAWDGMTPLDLAKKHNYKKIVEYLEKKKDRKVTVL